MVQSLTFHFFLNKYNELQKLHLNFGDSSARPLKNLINKTDPSKEEQGDITLGMISWKLDTCKKDVSAPRLLKHTVVSESISFNHTVHIDTMFVSNRYVLHMVDLETHSTTTMFLKIQSTAENCKFIQVIGYLV